MAAVLVILSVPRLGLGYFWDDYIFLTSSRANPASFLLPNPTTIFYRPISMGLYFVFLSAFGGAGALLGHVLNLLMLAGAVVLLATLVSSVAGRRAGLFAGFAFAALSSMPSLSAWITASQDVFAILFIVIALHFRQAGRMPLALAATACALLSKEPALALIPAIYLWPWLMQGKRDRLIRDGVLFLGVLLLWGAVHPGVRALLTHGPHSQATGYVHLQEGGHAALYMGRYVASLFNLPITGYPTAWPRELTPFAFAAVAILLAGIWAGRSARMQHEPRPPSMGRIALASALLALPPLLLDTALIGHWAPYYVGLAGIGGSLLMGSVLSKLPTGAAAGVLTLFLLLGVQCRGLDAPSDVAFSERNMQMGSRAIRFLEGRFKELRPTMPRGAELLISVGQSGTLGIFQSIIEGKAPRVWYDDPTLNPLPPERRTGRSPWLLFRTTPVMTVAEIEPDSVAFRWSGAMEPFPDEISGPVRAFARGSAAIGEVDRAVRILERLQTLPPQEMHPYDRRLTALVLLSAGREGEANAVLASTPAYPRVETIQMVKKLLLEPTGRARVDSCVYRTFGVSLQDTRDVRELLRMLWAEGHRREAVPLAARLQTLAPGDSESAAMLGAAR